MNPAAPLPWDGNSDDETDELDFQELRAGRRLKIFLIDATDPMFNKDINDRSYFQMCIEACIRILKKKIYRQEKDLIGIVLFGTKHKGQSGQADYVTTLQELAEPNADRIKELMTIQKDVDGFENKHGHSNNFSLAEALWHCSKLVSSCPNKTIQKTIFLMTCSDNPHAADPKLQQATRIRASELPQVDIRLEILPFGMTFNEDLFFKEIYKSTHEDDDNSGTSIKIMKEVDDIVDFVQLVTPKRSLCRVHWCLGNDVKLAVAVYSFIRPTPPYPKKVTRERYRNAEVKSTVQAFNTRTGEEVIRGDISKAVIIGGRTIKFDEEEFRNVKQITQPGLQLLGFKPVWAFEVWHQMKNTLFVYPEERKIKGSRVLFAALHKKCLDRRVAALCYFTLRQRSKPKIVALIPQAEKVDKDGTQHTPPGFLLRYIPYADNIRDLKGLQVKCPDPEPELTTLAEKIISGTRFKYKPDIFDNPKLRKHWAGIEALALGYETVEETPDDTLPQYDQMEKKIGKLSEDFMRLAFPDGLDADAITKTVKRSAPPKQSVAKKIKPDLDNLSIEDIAQLQQVEKLKVDKLKEYLQDKGIRTSKMLKADLVAAVYRHLGYDDQP